jgi:hypothetical protein
MPSFLPTRTRLDGAPHWLWRRAYSMAMPRWGTVVETRTFSMSPEHTYLLFMLRLQNSQQDRCQIPSPSVASTQKGSECVFERHNVEYANTAGDLWHIHMRARTRDLCLSISMIKSVR